MNPSPTSATQYRERFEDRTIACSQYAIGKMGVDRSRCLLKIDDYVILCAPFQLGFRRAVLIASLSRQEIAFFLKYKGGLVGLSMEFHGDKKLEPVKLFLRANLVELGQMKGRENVGLLVVDFKSTPDDLASILGSFLEGQERLETQYRDYARTPVRFTPDAAKALGYNQYALASDGTGERRIQVYALTSQTLEFLEASGASERAPGTPLNIQLFFRKYRVAATGRVLEATRMPTGIVRTKAALDFSAELVEILDDYWFASRPAPRSAS